MEQTNLLMITFMLLGILLCVRAEQRDFTRPVHYLLPGIAFTLATLVKFTALPLIALYLVLLARKTLYPLMSEAPKVRHLRWRATILLKVCSAGVAIGLVILLCYGPFFIGHSIKDMRQSFLIAAIFQSGGTFYTQHYCRMGNDVWYTGTR